MSNGLMNAGNTDGYRVEFQEKNRTLIYGSGEKLRRVGLDDHHIYVDGRLSEKLAACPYVYRSFSEAMANITDGTEMNPMNVYIAPYVYWLHDPASSSTTEPYGMVLNCEYLHLHGLTDDAHDVVIAANYGHDEGYDGANWTMFHVTGDGLHISNLTIGNYCNVDLEYPPDPSLQVPKRTTNITQAQIGFYDGDKLFCENVRFISRLNMMPFIAVGSSAGRPGRFLYVNCHMECTDDALNGAANTVYLGCDFEFYAPKPWYTGDGVTLLDCTMHIIRQYPGQGVTQYLTKNLDNGGKFTLVDCRFVCGDAGGKPIVLGYSEALPDSYRGYVSDVTLNGQPTALVGGGRYPRACVDITGTDVQKAYKVTDTDGNFHYNIYNLLRGDDGWDPFQQKELMMTLGAGAVRTDLRVTASAEVIESGVSGAVISVMDSEVRTMTDGSVTNPESGSAEVSSVRYSVSKEDAEYVILRDRGDGKCTVEGSGKETAKMVTADVVLPDGRASAVTFRVIPRRLKPPVVREKPYLTQNPGGTASIHYLLQSAEAAGACCPAELSETAGACCPPELECAADIHDSPEVDGRADRSRITWYLSKAGSLDDAIPIACGRGLIPLRSIGLNRGCIGYYLIAVIEPKHDRSDYGEAITVISEDRIAPQGIGKIAALDVDITHFSTKRQEKILPGVWTVGSYRPQDMVSKKSWALEGEDVYAYGTGKVSGAAGYTGLYQLRCGTRLMYTPEENIYGNMEARLLLVPPKTASQGFGSRNQYMDILIKLDSAAMTGFGLRIFRETSHSCGFGLISWRDGKTTFLTGVHKAACFVGEVTVDVRYANGLLSASCGTSEILPDPNMSSVVSFEVKAESNTSGGFAVVHTGTPGESAVYIVSMEIKWQE